MKLIFKACIVLLGLCLCLDSQAQTEGYDVFIPISKYMVQGNSDALSAWFDDSLEISVNGKGGDSSRTQARQILKAFFSSHTPHSFEITHTSGRSGMKYILGDLNAGGETYRVIVFAGCKDGGYKIQQLKIDRL